MSLVSLYPWSPMYLSLFDARNAKSVSWHGTPSCTSAASWHKHIIRILISACIVHKQDVLTADSTKSYFVWGRSESQGRVIIAFLLNEEAMIQSSKPSEWAFLKLIG